MCALSTSGISDDFEYFAVIHPLQAFSSATRCRPNLT